LLADCKPLQQGTATEGHSKETFVVYHSARGRTHEPPVFRPFSVSFPAGRPGNTDRIRNRQGRRSTLSACEVPCAFVAVALTDWIALVLPSTSNDTVAVNWLPNPADDEL